jgi:hypothetical protein
LEDVHAGEAQVRWLNTLRPANISRSDDTYKRIRKLLFPAMIVPEDDVGPLAAARARRPGAHEAWAAAARVNAQKALVTRGRRMMEAAGMFCKDDEAARLYVGAHLRKLAAAERLANTLALGLRKANGDADLMTYSLGGGRAYLCRFRTASEPQREAWRVLIRQEALAVRVKGAKESKAVVTERATEMLLGDDGLMVYRLGAPVFPYTFCIDTCDVIGTDTVTNTILFPPLTRLPTRFFSRGAQSYILVT